MWSNIPFDVLASIFSFLSPDSLARAISTCKNWHTCSKSYPFTPTTTTTWFLALPIRNHHHHHKKPCCYAHNPITSNWHELPLDFSPSPGPSIRPISPIGSLLLLKLTNPTTTTLQLALCNPFTRQFKHLPRLHVPRTNPATGVVVVNFVNGAVNVPFPRFRIYVAGGMSEAARGGGATYEPTIEMYDSMVDTWNVVGSMLVEFAVRLTVWTPNESVSIGGTTTTTTTLYWITSARAYSVMGFEVGTSTWREVGVPRAEMIEFATLVKRNGALALVGGTCGGGVCVWEMGEGRDTWCLVDEMPCELGLRLLSGKRSWESVKCVGDEDTICLYRDLGCGMVICNNIVNLISSILKQKSCQLSLLQDDDIKGILPHMGAHEVSRVLLRCQSDYSSALTFFNWVKNDLCITPTVHNYCVIVHILACSRVPSQAMKLLSELIQLVPNEDIYQSLVGCTEVCNWNPVVFDMLIKSYVKAGMVEKGLETFRKNIEACLIPNVVACNCLLSGLSKFNYIGHCWEVYEEMGRLGIHRNAYTFNILTHVLCKDGDTDKVNGFLEKMEEEGFEPDLVTYNTLINSYCRKRRLEDAFYLYKIMYIRGVVPNLISYTALMNGLCEEGKIKEAHLLFNQMVHRGIDPDVVSYNTLISGYCREGKMQMSRSLLHEMIGNGICPDSVTCKLIVRGYARDGKLLSALNSVVELQRFGIKIPENAYDYLIVALCNEGRPFAARSFLMRISQDGYVPKTSAYNTLVDSLCKFNNVEEALILKSEMIKKNMKLNLTSYRAIISCLCRENRTPEAEGLLEEMVSSGILPDLEIKRALINGYCEENDADKAMSLLKFFAKEFQVCDTVSYNAVVKAFSEVGNVAELMELQDRLLKVGYVPNSLTCKHMIRRLQKDMELDDEILSHNMLEV